MITVVPALSSVELDVRSAIPGSPCAIRITVLPPANYTIIIYFGDGTKTTENNVIDGFSGRKAFILERQHIYSQAGQYLLKVNVTNHVTWMHQSAVVLVEEAIRGIQVFTTMPAIVPHMQEVLVTAIMETGTDVTFEWNFGETQSEALTIVENGKNYSIARHTYKNPGLYHVTVKAANSLLSSPVIGRLATPFVVMEPIRTCIVRPVLGYFAAAFLPKVCNYEMDEECDWSMETEEIEFETQTYGSHVEFIFHYDDGRSEVIEPVHDTETGHTFGIGRHRFTAVGDYNVSVIARNSLSSSTANLAHLFSVQIPPDGVQLDKDYYIVQLGSTLTLTATVATGTDVAFDWWLGKELLYSKAGTEVHIPLSRIGVYEVAVEAVNKVTDLVGSPRATAKVVVQNILQAIELRILRTDSSKSSIVLSADDDVQLRAKVLPDSDSVDFFIWQFDIDMDNEFKSKFPFTTYRFNQEGRYILRVTATNTFGSVTSPPLEVTIVRKLERLSSVRHVSSAECNQSVYFHAQFWFGSHLTFRWDFGDGSEIVETTVPYAEHSFHKVGEYWVKLYVWNQFSSGNITTNIFVLEDRCDKPEVAFLEQSKDRKIIFGTEIRLEADVEIVCQASWVVAYTWKVLQGEREVSLPPLLLRERTLVLTGGEPMVPGNYTVQLKVAMNGTIVYASVETSLTVLWPPLQVVIHGGTNRLVNRKNDVIFNVTCTSCGHPDVRFQWTCQPLSFSRAPCFDFSSPDMTQPNLTFAASALRMLPHNFLFSLTATRGQEQSSANQIIHIDDGETSVDVSIFCPNCEAGIVDRDAHITFQALCKGCDALQRPLITWQLWLVKDGKHNLALSNYDCVQPDGSTFYLNVSANFDNESSIAFGLDIQEVYPTQKKLNVEEENDDRSLDSITWIPFKRRYQREIIVEPSTAPRSWYHEGPVEEPENDGGIVLSEDLQNLSNEEHEAPLFSPFSMPSPDWNDLAKEGTPGEAGSANARDHRKHILDDSLLAGDDDIFEEQSGGRTGANRLFGKSEADSDGDALKSDRAHHYQMNHLLNAPRVPFDLEDESTTTGFHSWNLIIRPGILKVGRTYIAQAIIRDEANRSVEWSALQAATVNVGPVNGRCTLMPTVGVELDTRFKLDCLEWRVQKTPILYELSYSLTPAEPATLIYYGMDHNFKFNLPMGLPDNNHRVYLNVVIRDGSGIGTKVCSIVREVQPRATGAKENIEEWIYRDVTANSSALAKLISERNCYLSLQRLRVLLTVLNRESPIALELRRNIRQQMTLELQGFPRRNKMEAIQILTVLNEILERPKEIVIDVLPKSVHTLAGVVESWSQLLPINGYQQDWSLIVVQALSHILTTISIGKPEIPIAFIGKRRSADSLLASDLNSHILTDQTISLLLKFLHLECQSRKNDRDPLIYQTEYMVTWSFCNNEISWKPEFLQTNIVWKEENMEKHFIVFSNSPFIDSTNERVNINTEVVMMSSSLADYTEILSDEITVDISYPLNIDGIKAIENGTIRRAEMNLHRFSALEFKHNQTLFVYVQFNERRKSDFAVELLISSSSIPKLSNIMFSQVFGAKEGDAMIYVSADMFLESGDYFIGIADATQSKKAVSLSEINQRSYILRVWWTECFYWSNFTQSWSQNGCTIQPLRNFSHVRCSCFSSNPIGASYQIQQTEFTTTVLLGTLIDEHSASPALLLVAILVLLYIITLLPCYFADIRDEKKKQIHYLVDNSSTDKQIYSITIVTGDCPGAGTTATVYLILHGEEGMSETRELTDDISRGLLFQRSSRDTFIMTTPSSLGSIWKVQIWHNNGGNCPSWFLSTLAVTDMNSGSVYFFECQKWLAVEEDEKIEREILQNEISWTFKKVLYSTWLLHFSDSHLWFPVIRGSTYSNFYRIPRITCCLILLLTSAGLEAFWFSYKTKEISDYESFLISLESLLVSAVVGIILMPLQLLLIVLFKYTKVPNLKLSCGFLYPQVKKCLVKSNTEPIEEAYPLQDSVDGIQSSQLSLDQSLSTWRALQEWARLQWLKHSEYISALEEELELEPTNQKENIGSVMCHYSPETRGDEESDVDKYDIVVSGVSTNRANSGSQEFLLPVWCRILTWAICWLLVTGASTIILAFGYGFSRNISNRWLITWYLTVLWNVFIIPHLIVTILALYSAFQYLYCPLNLFCYQHKNYKEVLEAHWKTNGTDVVTAEDLEKQEIEKRRRSRYLRFARPPSEKKLIQDRKEKLKEKYSFAITKYICLSSFFLLYFVLTVRSWDFQSAFLINKSINHFVTRRPSQFLEIKSQADWWTWMMYEGIEIFSVQFTDIDDQLPLKNTESFLLGPLRLTEIKRSRICSSYNHSKSLCDDELLSLSIRQSNLKNNTWYQPKYISQLEKQISLSINGSDLVTQLKELQEMNWISNETHEVKLECILYHPATSFFTLLQLFTTFNVNDGISIATESVAIKFDLNSMDIFLIALKLFLATLCLWKIQNYVEKLIRDWTGFWSQNWNWIHGLFHVIFLIYLGFEAYFQVLLFKTSEELRHFNGNQFIDIFNVIVWRQVISGMEGVLIFSLVIMVTKSLFPPTSITRIEQTFLIASKEIAYCAIKLVLLVTCFSFFGHWWFGNNNDDFSSVLQSSLYLIKLMVKGLKNGEVHFPNDDDVGVIYIISFAACIFAIVVAQMKAIINQNYKLFSLKRNSIIQVPLLEIFPILFRKLISFFKKTQTEDHRDSSNANQLHVDFNLLELEEQVNHMLNLMEQVCKSVDIHCEEKKSNFDETYEDSEQYYFDEEELKALAENIEDILNSQKTLSRLNGFDSFNAEISELPDYSTLSYDLELLLKRHPDSGDSFSSLSSSLASVHDTILHSQATEKASSGSSQAFSPSVPHRFQERPFAVKGQCVSTANPFLQGPELSPKRKLGLCKLMPNQSENLLLRNLRQQGSSSSSDHQLSAKKEKPVRNRRGLRKTTSRGKGKAKTEWNFEDLLISGSETEDEAV